MPQQFEEIACWTLELRTWLDGISREAGFASCGVAEARDPDDPVAGQDAARFAAWVDRGHAGEMDYLKRRDGAGTLLRSGPRAALPWARSVIVCAFNYNADAPKSIDPAPPHAGWIGRYAWSGQVSDDGAIVPTDYHDELLRRLRIMEREIQQCTPCTTRCYVDTGPLLERNLAAQAGVGWIGKNTCVLNQQFGSWLLLGVIVTSLPVAHEAAALIAPDRCGTCTRCIDACPTGALLGSPSPDAPRDMDASRCIAYLTIEKKGAIDESLRPLMGRQVFGCDICQDVCPWNREAPIGGGQGMHARGELINPALDWLARMDASEFKRRFRGSPLERTGRNRLLRNTAIAMGNSGDARFLPQLANWATDASANKVLHDAATWARTQILVHIPTEAVLQPPNSSASIESRPAATPLSRSERLDSHHSAPHPGALISTITPDTSGETAEAVEPAPGLVQTDLPIASVRPTLPAAGFWPQTLALGRYMSQTEVHTYAFSVAANVILSLFPFIVMMLTLSRQVFHSQAMEQVVGEMMSNFLPSNQAFIMSSMRQLAHPHKGAQVFSVIMLLISSTGVFLPLEVALNQVWGVRKNRSYLHNQAVSLGLAVGVGALAMSSIALTAAQKTVLTWIFFQHTDNIVFNFLNGGMLRLFALVASILLFFLIYWILPHRSIPARAVLPTAIVIGLVWEFAKYLYVLALPHLDFQAVYGPFYVSVGLMMWAFLSGLLLLAGAHFSATRYALSAARQEDDADDGLNENPTEAGKRRDAERA